MDRFIIRTKIVKQSETDQASTSHQSQTSSDEFDDQSNENAQDSSMKVDSDPTARKRKIYDVKYRENWKIEFKWLTEKSQKAYCTFCNKSLSGGKKHLQRHSESEIHKKNERKLQGTVDIPTTLAKVPSNLFNKEVKSTELKLVMFAMEHNLSFVLFEHLPKFICSLPEKSVLQSVKCSRTKAASLVNNKIGPFSQAALADILKKCFFSIIIDETTDISAKKCLVIIVRYFSQIEKKVDSFFGLIEVVSATADSIFKAVISLIEKLNIPIANIIGFSSDNASVMMGHINGVKAKFMEIIPNIFVMGCLSHSMHLCASKACAKLPNEVEDFARNIYNYFAHSAKRQHDFKEFQQFAEAEPHKLPRPCQTRWLSLEAVVNRILEQWDALILYFQSEALLENVYGAQEILNSLINIKFKIYFRFLQHILKIVCKMNLEFQSESPRIHKLIPIISMYFRTICNFFLKSEVMTKIEIARINPQNPDYFKTLDDIYFGANFEMELNKNIHKLSKPELEQIKLNCLNFYIVLCTEIRTRVDFKN
ncbi:unnamed protein product [Psylliodes chrysocephalus]|uniref:Uncharacterized protein n=1 Tax=Psylliodes chrysocephalus TaxID=3402493 RepID=A0A9P0CYV4_9CUCU|nr:unnamed protein product [Psylliodes chrysocephala]